ncbi:uncharacterized protein METZ01_LOCUS189083 [marine metagenome]|uniref:Uncharacterized protein n=1 Tax=marine metagenome TaxID=408172 RepID=A0A382DDL2_9ZZZZ
MTDPAPNTAIVTGASRGLGAAIASHFARRGWSLGLCARGRSDLESTAERVRRAGAPAVFADAIDIVDAEGVAGFAHAVETSIGPVRLVVNNAAVFGPVGPLADINLQHWHNTMAIGVGGTANVIAAFWPQLDRVGNGRIVNLSGGGLGGPGLVGNASAYAASKAAVVVLTEALAPEVAGIGATINAVAPGALPTGFMDEALAAGPDRAGHDLYESAEALRRRDEGVEPPDRLVALIEFLLEPANSWLNGCVLSARWDTPERLLEQRKNIEAGDRCRLRRIDGDLYTEVDRRA